MRFKQSPLVTASGKRILEGSLWFFHRPNSRYYGSFPVGFEKRLLKYYNGNLILNVCCGTSGIGIRVDINRNVKPTVCADAQHLPFRDNIVNLAVIDPPYNTEYAKHYNCKYPSMPKILAEAVRVCKPETFICYLHLVMPKKPKGVETECYIAVAMGPEKQLRILCIYRKLTNLTHFSG